MTFADMEGKLARKKAKYEKLLNSHNPAEKTAAMLMYKRAQDMEDMLFESQESQKAPEAPAAKPMYGKGKDLTRVTPPAKVDTSGIPIPTLAPSIDKNTLATPYKPETDLTDGMSKWQNANKIANAGNMVLNGVDYFTKMAAIGQMQAPPKPVETPLTWFNKTLNTGSFRNSIARSRMTAERFANQLPSSQVAVALKQKAGVDSLNKLGEVYDKEQNFATEMTNKEAQLNQYTRMSNVQESNRYLTDVNNFQNNRIAASQNAASSLMTKDTMALKDQMTSRQEVVRWMLDSMKYDPTIRKDILGALGKI
jgi:hypothetical protein